MSPDAKGWEPVYRVVRRIPSGRIASYGQVAALAGMPGAARQIGWALSALAGDDGVPWHRVVNAKGEVSPRGAREFGELQRALLEAEGVGFDARGRIDLERHAWKPEAGRTSSFSKTPKDPKRGRRRNAGGRAS